ncbi:MAG: hypothetical protein KJ914_09150 [Gammaproteobacteria bacterium]|nr:hypothetical protein [Gammaproteobacteria bacterium]MBU1723646.1 hypothetical protein [Gammaproteobacteria bacterium]MBU2005642.1 hypothetical protein [Gammaproteobacteria bacterium]
MPLKSIIFYFMAFIILSILTEVGGLALLFSIPVMLSIRNQYRNRQKLIRFGIFTGAYLLTVFIVIPLLAPLYGRVQLPCFATESAPLKPDNFGYCLLMRNYVKLELRDSLIKSTQILQGQYPGIKVRYLDANFPFRDGIPLFPHLSHNDGKKVDIAFFYKRKGSTKTVDFSPSFIGYWFYEQPLPQEKQPCKNQASWLRWDFNWLQPLYNNYEIDIPRTRALLQLLTKNVQKIFVEPHLKQRLGVQSGIIRFQGCRAARHDDHIHVQVK